MFFSPLRSKSNTPFRLFDGKRSRCPQGIVMCLERHINANLSLTSGGNTLRRKQMGGSRHATRESDGGDAGPQPPGQTSVGVTANSTVKSSDSSGSLSTRVFWTSRTLDTEFIADFGADVPTHAASS